MPVTRIVFWRNGQGFLYDGSINFGGDDGFYQVNDTGTQTIFSRRELEDAVAWLQKDLAEYWKELRDSGVKGPANPRTTRRSGFTSTPVPRYSGKSSWEEYR